MLIQYHSAIIAIWFIIVTIIVQGFVAVIAHRKQKDAVPGIIDSHLGHKSFVFRSHRTYQNSLENIVQLITPAILGLFIGINPTSLAIVLWVYAIARVMHMMLYYFIATNKNPSPRSYFYVIGLLANLYLLGMIAVKLF